MATWLGSRRMAHSVGSDIFQVHHDVAVRTLEADGVGPELLALTVRARIITAVHPTEPILDNGLLRLDGNGAPIEETSLYDLFRDNADAPELQSVTVRGKDGIDGIDLFHSNAIQWMSFPELEAVDAVHRVGYLLLTIRHQDMIVVLDWEARRIVWTWGPGILDGPHDATWLANGNLLVFDNGLKRGWSRVLEIEPISRKIVWRYPTDSEESFFSRSQGSAQRLPNGNTLIVESNSGRAFEVTREGETVWEFLSPHFGPKGGRATIGRMRRLPTWALGGSDQLASCP